MIKSKINLPIIKIIQHINSHAVSLILSHGGVLIILVGALFTKFLGVEGEISLYEGQVASGMTVDRTVKEYSLDFKLQLESFDIDYYPGTQRPMEYRSKIRLLDPKRGIDREELISMNHPVCYQGFRIYQSGYRKTAGGGLALSVFSVNRDPGVFFIYMGGAIMLIGIYMSFFLKGFIGSKVILSYLIALSLFVPVKGYSDEKMDYSKIERIPIQHNGRIKSFQSFADETVRLITGRENFRGDRSVEIVLKGVFDSREILEQQMIYIPYLNIKRELRLDSQRNYFSLGELNNLKNLERKLKPLMQNDPQFNRDGKNWIKLYEQIDLMHEWISGRIFRIIFREGKWLSLIDLESRNDRDSLLQVWKDLGDAFCRKDARAFKTNSEKLYQALSHQTGFVSKINIEVISNQIDFFKKAGWMYLFAFLLMIFLRDKKEEVLSSIIFMLAFVFHTIGLFSRAYISGRVPVSNMYESLIFMAWGICFFSILVTMRHRNRMHNIISSLLGSLILFIASYGSFDSSIDPLMPVLRSNFWLTLHVLSIMLGYSALTLGMGLGHFMIGAYFFLPNKKEWFRTASEFLQKSLKFGFFFLVLGTLLGGAWAHQAWGRFWGWDPKETCALITIIGYAIIFHLFWAGWIKDFGLAIFSILGFFLILMTYYGVNFILAKGLHQYGFNSGGVLYVTIYIWIEIVFISVSGFERYIREKKKEKVE